jgi:hypothetical protein
LPGANVAAFDNQITGCALRGAQSHGALQRDRAVACALCTCHRQTARAGTKSVGRGWRALVQGSVVGIAHGVSEWL